MKATSLIVLAFIVCIVAGSAAGDEEKKSVVSAQALNHQQPFAMEHARQLLQDVSDSDDDTNSDEDSNSGSDSDSDGDSDSSDEAGASSDDDTTDDDDGNDGALSAGKQADNATFSVSTAEGATHLIELVVGIAVAIIVLMTVAFCYMWRRSKRVEFDAVNHEDEDEEEQVDGTETAAQLTKV